MATAVLHISSDRIDDLHRALRRHQQTEALEIVSRIAKQPDVPNLVVWAKGHHVGERIPDVTTRWALEQIAQHVADNRFEHALCLVERYGAYYANAALSGFSSYSERRAAE